MEERQLYDTSKKCGFWLEQVVFLCHGISKEGMKVNLKENSFKVAKTNP